jgi:NADH-quinone oxidoreductase subunit M
VAAMKDINGREAFVLGAFAVVVLGIGIWPEPLVHLMGGSINHLVHQLAISKI